MKKKDEESFGVILFFWKFKLSNVDECIKIKRQCYDFTRQNPTKQ